MAANATSKALQLTWRSSRPKNQKIVQLTESLTALVAKEYGADTAIIRKEPHDTTRVMDPSTGGYKYEPTQMHVTGFVLKKGENVGHAFHYYTDDKKEKPLPATDENPNPKVWEMKSANNTGFTFPDGEEIKIQ